MSRESLFAARMTADATLAALLPGGVYQAMQLFEPGIARSNAQTANAFDTDINKSLKTCALVRERAEVPDGVVRDGMVQLLSTVQVVEVWAYKEGTLEALDLIKDRMISLFEGWPIDSGFEVFLVNVIRDRDRGALKGAALLKMDWQVNSIVEG